MAALLRAVPFFEAGQLDAQRRMFFADRAASASSSSSLLALSVPAPLPARARSVSFSATALRLRSRCSSERSALTPSRSSSSRATESRELARAVSSASLRIS